ncbi:hypothetical protein JW948_03040 [bacterium]|nr:hypothetical protein [bacterium]
MEWTIKVDKEKQVVEIVTGGLADKNGSLGMVGAIVSVSMENDIKNILIDHRNIQSVSGDTFEVYDRPKQFQETGGTYEIRIAEVIKPEHSKFFQFLETVFVNRGFSFKLFFDKNSALQWLLRNECP